MSRYAKITRKTSETDIVIEIELDGSGKADINTGIGFFDHMLNSFARHGLFDLTVKVEGDLKVDCHHTVEDTGIALGDKKSIKRFGSFMLPMDESLVLCAIDLSGRPYFVYDADIKAERVGEFDTEMAREFFYAISYSAGMNLHIKELYGSNAHHIIEAMFKSFARALDAAVSTDPRVDGIPSTKGAL